MSDELSTIEIAAIVLRADHAEAKVDGLLRLIKQLVIDREQAGGYATAEQQDTLRWARAVLAEHGR